MNAWLADLPVWSLGFTLVLARTGAALSFLPGLGETAAPPMVRAGIALALTVLLLPSLLPLMPPPPDSGGRFALMVAAEVVTGVWFGWLSRLAVLSLPIAAQYLAYLLGLSSVLQTDPELGAQTTAIARMAATAMPVIVLGSGLYTQPIEALHGLYALVPPGTIPPFADGAAGAVQAVVRCFVLALRLASPFAAACIVWHVSIGLAARLVPRLQIYFVAAPGQILGGLVLLASLSGMLLGVWGGGVRLGFANLPGAR